MASSKRPWFGSWAMSNIAEMKSCLLPVSQTRTLGGGLEADHQTGEILMIEPGNTATILWYNNLVGTQARSIVSDASG